MTLQAVCASCLRCRVADLPGDALHLLVVQRIMDARIRNHIVEIALAIDRVRQDEPTEVVRPVRQQRVARRFTRGQHCLPQLIKIALPAGNEALRRGYKALLTAT